MARILALNPPFRGMSTIVNVLQRVGPEQPNDTADVRVVQRLIGMAGRGTPGSRIGLPVSHRQFRRGDRVLNPPSPERAKAQSPAADCGWNSIPGAGFHLFRKRPLGYCHVERFGQRQKSR